MQYKTYKKEDPYSYALGAFPAMEVLKQKPELIQEMILSERFTDLENLEASLASKGINYIVSDKQLARIANKGNIYMAAVFQKRLPLARDNNHIVLVNPGDMGNMGTIMRTMAAFSYRDLILIGGGCDPYHPKTVRSSMGALFYLHMSSFPTIQDYLNAFPQRDLYPFMLSETATSLMELHPEGVHSLIFGNEGSGLPAEFAEIGKAVMIPQSHAVDSLNLTIAAGIAMYYFTEGEVLD